MNIKYLGAAGYELWREVTTVSGLGSGSIQLEYSWNLISVPVEFGYWNPSTHQHVHDGTTVARIDNYIIDQLDDLYGVGTVEVANAYLGDNQYFWNFVPYFTPITSEHNFPMIWNDGVHKEILGFWVKVVGGAAPYTITWGN